MAYTKVSGWSFTEVKKNSNLGQRLIERWNNYEGVQLWDVYGHYSRQKECAFNEIEEFMRSVGGWSLCITSHCVSQFSCALLFMLEGTKALAYFTRDHNYLIRNFEE